MYPHVFSDPLHFAVSLILVVREDLTSDTGLSVTVTVNPFCRVAVYPVLASFGIQMADSCSVQQNDTDSATPGNSVTLTANPDNIPLGTDQNYCVVISSNGEIGRWLHTCVHNSDIIIVLVTMSKNISDHVGHQVHTRRENAQHQNFLCIAQSCI